ncbi:MAG: cysteine--tRNA ligase [Pseudomonadota bacterium]|nr:cysteine--tRNA ligase [Pseudomonadota bacterium]
MSLVLYDTKARAKREFVPIDPERVGIYVCGPTVYDRAHIGNARPVIVFDVLYRLLRRIFGKGNVTYVRNITDVDDKIIAAAQKSGRSISDITAGTTQVFQDDMVALGALPPDHEPRATEHIEGMVAMAETLIARGHAYEAEGHVLFDVPSMDGYGALSRRSQKEMIAGARVEVAPYKKSPADFVLWKPSSEDQPGWDSPWGRGRPGWHLECSVMSEKYLGVPVDIHGGGQDLIFPHHENERAQSLCANDGLETFANYWMHNGFVVVEGEKMSKSLGNFRNVDEVLADFGRDRGEVARLLMLGTHYRKPLDWTAAGVREAKSSLDRLYTALAGLGDIDADGDDLPDAVVAALEDDLNTPKVVAELYALSTAANKATDAMERAKIKGAMLAVGEILGLLGHDAEEWFKGHDTGSGHIDDLIEAREAARVARDFATADRIRDELLAEGIVLEDSADGTRWKRAG